MTDSQIVMGIMQNDDRVWKHICRNVKPRFCATLRGLFTNEKFGNEDLEEIFQESCVTLMGNVKKGKYQVRDGSSLFSYFVEIGKMNTLTFLRKKRRGKETNKEEKDDKETGNIIQFIPQRGNKMQRFEPGKDYVPLETEEEKQRAQDEFLDRVFDSIPSDCKRILKLFHWDHKPMDEIASILGMKNADSAKTKKSKCMQKFKDIGKMLLNSGEFAEEAVRGAVERAALRELLEDERAYCEMDDVEIAAFKTDEGEDCTEEKKD